MRTIEKSLMLMMSRIPSHLSYMPVVKDGLLHLWMVLDSLDSLLLSSVALPQHLTGKMVVLEVQVVLGDQVDHGRAYQTGDLTGLQWKMILEVLDILAAPKQSKKSDQLEEKVQNLRVLG